MSVIARSALTLGMVLAATAATTGTAFASGSDGSHTNCKARGNAAVYDRYNADQDVADHPLAVLNQDQQFVVTKEVSEKFWQGYRADDPDKHQSYADADRFICDQDIDHNFTDDESLYRYGEDD